MSIRPLQLRRHPNTTLSPENGPEVFALIVALPKLTSIRTGLSGARPAITRRKAVTPDNPSLGRVPGQLHNLGVYKMNSKAPQAGGLGG